MAPNRILIVDDQIGVRHLLKTLFSEHGLVTFLAANGQEAVQAVAAHYPDLVLMDVRMPVMGGTEALAKIKQMFPEQPVLMMTAYADDEKLSELRSLGAVDCLLKPLDLNYLLSRVQELLGSFRKRAE